MISSIKQHYFNKYGISLQMAEKKALVKNENGMITAATEMVGDKIIKLNSLFDKLFPNNTGYKKETRKKYQKLGVDYWVFDENGEEIAIDIKVNIGPDYSMEKSDYTNTEIEHKDSLSIPVEIYQNGDFTNSDDKLTDYMLYFILDNNNQYYKLIEYSKIRNISLKHKYVDEAVSYSPLTVKRVNKGDFSWHQSNNGTGIYIKVPCQLNIIGE